MKKPVLFLADVAKVITWPIRKLGGAASHTKVGAFILTGAAMVAAGFGIKHFADKHDARKNDELLAAAPEAGSLQENIRRNQIRLSEVSAELGQNNRQGNFRAAVRGNGIAPASPIIFRKNKYIL